MILFRNVFVEPDELKQRQLIPGAQRPSRFMSVAVGLFAAMGGFIFGYDTGLINSISEMEYVRQHFASNPGQFTAPESAIVTGILSLGTFVGAITAPLISDTLGRRIAIIFSTFIVFMIGNICQISSTELKLFCIGRFITGLSVGILSAVVPVYQAEASPKFARGAVISSYQWTITWGLMVSSAVSQGTQAMNSTASYRIPIALQFVWSLILGVGMLFLPETPRFYVMKDDIHKAAMSLSRLRRVPVDDPGLIEELIEIKASHDYEKSFQTKQNSLVQFFKSDGARPHQLKRVITGVTLQAIQQCSGINFIFYYGVNFFSRTGVSKSYLVSFVTYAVNVVATVPGIMLVETAGRRKVLMIGGTIMGFANILIAIVGVTTDSIVANKVMIAFVCLFIASFAASWAPVVWVVCGEIFSLSVRGKAVALTAATNWLVNFAFAYCTPYLFDTGYHTAALGTKIFFIWGSFNLSGVVFVYFMVFETRGLSLEQIDELYRKCPSARASPSFKVNLKFNTSARNTGANNSDNEGDDLGNTSKEMDNSLQSDLERKTKYSGNDFTGNNAVDNLNNGDLELTNMRDNTIEENNINEFNENNENNENSFNNNLNDEDYSINQDGDVDESTDFINLGYGMCLAGQKRGPPSLMSMSTDGSESVNDYMGFSSLGHSSSHGSSAEPGTESNAGSMGFSLNEYVQRLSSGDRRLSNNTSNTNSTGFQTRGSS